MKSIYVDSQGNEWENGGTYTDASLVKMTDGTTTQKAITDLQNRDINTFGTSDKWNGGSYSKGAYTIYNDTLYECIVANSNTVPTNTTYWKKVSLSVLCNSISWKFIDSKYGFGQISLPSDFTEILIRTYNNSISQARILVIPRIALSDDILSFAQGATSGTQFIAWSVSKSVAYLNTFNVDAEAQISNCYTSVYYR